MDLLLYWKTRIVAPDPRAPLIIELWFKESLIIKPPYKLTPYANEMSRKVKKTVLTKIISLTKQINLPHQGRNDG